MESSVSILRLHFSTRTLQVARASVNFEPCFGVKTACIRTLPKDNPETQAGLGMTESEFGLGLSLSTDTARASLVVNEMSPDSAASLGDKKRACRFFF